MYQYRLYGLNISSSRKIDLLTEDKFTKSVDLKVVWHNSRRETPDNSLKWRRVTTEFLDKLDVISLWETDLKEGLLTKVCFELENGRKINILVDSKRQNLSIYHPEDAPAGDLDSYLVGPVLSFTLRLREVVCLHSSVVGIDGKAVLFIGRSESGKSTIAAGLADAGAEILADDVAVLDPTGAGFTVQTGYSKVRLRPQAARFLSDDPEDLPIVYSYRDSRYFSLKNGNKFRSKPLPLAAIYVMGEISNDYLEPFIRAIEPQDRLINLVKNTSCSFIVTGDLRAKEFQILAQIAKTIPIRKLHYAHDIATLPRQCEVIIRDFRNLAIA